MKKRNSLAEEAELQELQRIQGINKFSQPPSPSRSPAVADDATKSGSGGQRRYFPPPSSHVVFASGNPEASPLKSQWDHHYEPHRMVSGSTSHPTAPRQTLSAYAAAPTAHTPAFVESKPFATEETSLSREKKHFHSHHPQQLAELVGLGPTMTASTMGFEHTSRRHFLCAASSSEADQLAKVHSIQHKFMMSKDVQGDRSRLISLAPMLRVRLKNLLTKGQLGNSWEGELEHCSVPELCRLFLNVGVELTHEEAVFAAAMTAAEDQRSPGNTCNVAPNPVHLGRTILFFADLLAK